MRASREHQESIKRERESERAREREGEGEREREGEREKAHARSVVWRPPERRRPLGCQPGRWHTERPAQRWHYGWRRTGSAPGRDLREGERGSRVCVREREREGGSGRERVKKAGKREERV